MAAPRLACAPRGRRRSLQLYTVFVFSPLCGVTDDCACSRVDMMFYMQSLPHAKARSRRRRRRLRLHITQITCS